jgi:hypothetical protein
LIQQQLLAQPQECSLLLLVMVVPVSLLAAHV